MRYLLGDQRHPSPVYVIRAPLVSEASKRD
jgi:hypothetical protein